MKPSVQDATHFHYTTRSWYKVGEQTVYVWDDKKNGWQHSQWCSVRDVSPMYGFLTAQEALEQGYKYPPEYPTTSPCNPPSSASQELLELSERQLKICEVIDRFPNLTVEDVAFLKENGYSVSSACVWKPSALPSMTEANDKQKVPVPTTSANNRQVGGDHYKKMKIQPWAIYDSIFNHDEQVGFYLGNTLKYLFRYKNKAGLQDLDKAKHYLEKLIEVERTNGAK